MHEKIEITTVSEESLQNTNWEATIYKMVNILNEVNRIIKEEPSASIGLTVIIKNDYYLEAELTIG